MIEEWDYSANNLLHHFRAILRGWWPFSLATKDMQNVRKQVDIDEEATVYLTKVCTLLEKQSTCRFRELLANLEK